MNICANCKHFENGGEWHEQFCTSAAAEYKKGIDPQTGEERYVTEGGYPAYERYPLAREINPKGECELYEASLRHSAAERLGKMTGKSR